VNQKAIEQLGRALDNAFGRPGFAQFALDNIELIKALDEAVKSFNGAMQEADKRAQEQPNGTLYPHD
jgi:hypothetical protein